jgi:hypothetical protein
MSTESQVWSSVECNSKQQASISCGENKPIKQAMKHSRHSGLFYRSSHSMQSGTSPLRKLNPQPALKRALSSFTSCVESFWSYRSRTGRPKSPSQTLGGSHTRLGLLTNDSNFPVLEQTNSKNTLKLLGGTSTTNYLVLKHSLLQISSSSRWMHKSNALLEAKGSFSQQQCACYGMVKVRVKSPLRSPIYRVPDN